mmetsp:Transcript_14259/g.28397  ORF Transcript_14259/g.28397 Transcript_14259/m.28397 type:complete len:144 (-) Transcript_14259:62-493(-)
MIDRRCSMKICLVFLLLPMVSSMSWPPSSCGGRPALRMRGGSSLGGSDETEKDPQLRRQKLASVPKVNHKEEFQIFKAKNFNKYNKGPVVPRLFAFIKGSIMNVRDLILDNTGNFIYKALPFAIALLHLPFFKPVTEGMPAFE